MGVSPIFSAKVIKLGRSHISQTETREGIELVFHFFFALTWEKASHLQFIHTAQ